MFIIYLLPTDLALVANEIEQSLNNDFGASIHRPIFLVDFVQMFLRGIRLMSNKKDRNFYGNHQFLPLFILVSRGIFEINALNDQKKMAPMIRKAPS